MVVCSVEYDKTTDKATDRVTKGVDDEDITITNDVTNCELGPKVNTLSTLVRNNISFTKVDGSAYDTPTVVVPDCITNKTKCEAGTPIAVEVAPNTIYKFYVLNDDITKNENYSEVIANDIIIENGDKLILNPDFYGVSNYIIVKLLPEN